MNKKINFRKFPSKHIFGFCYMVDDYQGDGFISFVLHFFKRAVSLDILFNGNRPYLKKDFRYFPFSV
jgi:hypothetical protein